MPDDVVATKPSPTNPFKKAVLVAVACGVPITISLTVAWRSSSQETLGFVGVGLGMLITAIIMLPKVKFDSQKVPGRPVFLVVFGAAGGASLTAAAMYIGHGSWMAGFKSLLIGAALAVGSYLISFRMKVYKKPVQVPAVATAAKSVK